jgi:peptide/nickel transport system permease protein
MPVTLALNALELLLILAIGIPIGIYSATRQYSLADRVTTVFVFLGFAMPTFWLALLCMMVFGVKLGWLPISGIKSMEHDLLTAPMRVGDYASHLVMPVLVAALTGLAGISRYMRSSMLEVVRQDYVTTARAKGLSERDVIYRHALRNALLPVITILGLSLARLDRRVGDLRDDLRDPGMGRLFYDGVMMRDYPLVMGVLVIGAVLTLVGNLLADVSYAIADPRLRRR